MKNLDIRLLVGEKGLHYKDIAEKMGILNTSLSRMMRKDLTPAQRERILSAIQEMEKAE